MGWKYRGRWRTFEQLVRAVARCAGLGSRRKVANPRQLAGASRLLLPECVPNTPRQYTQIEALLLSYAKPPGAATFCEAGG